MLGEAAGVAAQSKGTGGRGGEGGGEECEFSFLYAAMMSGRITAPPIRPLPDWWHLRMHEPGAWLPALLLPAWLGWLLSMTGQ